MSGHVVGAFGGVAVVGRVFRDHLVEMTFKILADGGVGVFGNGEAGGSVLNENVRQTYFNLFELRKLGFQQIGN